MYIKRNELIAEELVRTYVRQRIKNKINEENKLRSFLRKVISEVETGTEEASEYTGINVLANLLEKIIPIIEDDFKMLTTSEEQRESFRNHIIHAIKNALKPIEATNTSENTIYQLDKSLLAEKMQINMSSDGDDPADYVEGDFIDIDAPDEDEGFVHLDDQNETGRNFAATTFKQVEKQIVDAYDMLADDEDQKLFYDYLITNMLLYFDKFEDELQTQLPDTTTPEYEEKKDKEPESNTPQDVSSDDSDAASSPAEGGDLFGED
jgi:hypothetical protein